MYDVDDSDIEEPTTISEYAAEQQFEEMLGEVYGEVEICGMTFDAGRALKELDPIAFRESMLNYYNDLDIEII